jgi:hypothetical protein
MHIRSAGQSYEPQILSTITRHSGIRIAHQLHTQLLSRHIAVLPTSPALQCKKRNLSKVRTKTQIRTLKGSSEFQYIQIPSYFPLVYWLRVYLHACCVLCFLELI